ncbi:MAG: xanthine dehydrogenase family protein subunit M [Desulfobacterales bacterium]|nr:xanthine dehydrogenase family protein subunit M [Desulfobacterales bacterium]
MRLPRFEYLSPQTVQEACSLLSQHGDKARVKAGGTDLLNQMKERIIKPEYIIGLNSISDLDYIEADADKVRIGALTTLTTLNNSQVIKDKFPCLAAVPNKMATVQIRNMGTLGGNLCNAAPSADSAPILICLGAQAKIVGPNGDRLVALEDFFTGPGQTVLGDDEILAEIQVPDQAANTGGAYLKMSRISVDLALVGVAVVLTMDGDTCKDIKITLGAVAPTPIRAKKAEKALKGKKIDEGLIEKAGKIASDEASPIDDVRSSAFYRTEIVKVYTKRAIRQALEGTK